LLVDRDSSSRIFSTLKPGNVRENSPEGRESPIEPATFKAEYYKPIQMKTPLLWGREKWRPHGEYNVQDDYRRLRRFRRVVR
jgi:hypothetical protein